MEALILAGGMGTRLRDIVVDVPKPMAQINGRPFLEYIFEWISRYSVGKAILSVGYKAESVMQHFGDSFSGIRIEYTVEEKPLGTGGAVKYALKKTTGRDILIINGDTYFPIDLDRFYQWHVKNDHLFSMALKRMKNSDRYGSVALRGSTIVKFYEKKFSENCLINGGIYLINRSFIESRPLPEIFSLEKELMEKEAGTSILKGRIFKEMFIDIGIPEDYKRAQALLGDFKGSSEIRDL